MFYTPLSSRLLVGHSFSFTITAGTLVTDVASLTEYLLLLKFKGRGRGRGGSKEGQLNSQHLN